METHLRSVVKGMSWRVIATLVTTIVVWLISPVKYPWRCLRAQVIRW